MGRIILGQVIFAMKKINCIRTTLEMEEVNDDNDEDKQEQSSLGVEEGENSCT